MRDTGGRSNFHAATQPTSKLCCATSTCSQPQAVAVRRAGQPVRRTDTSSQFFCFLVYRWLRIAIICVQSTIAYGFGLVAVVPQFDLLTSLLAFGATA